MEKDKTNDLNLFVEDLAKGVRQKLGKTKEELPLMLYSEDSSKDMRSVIANSGSSMGGFFPSIVCTKADGINAITNIIVFDNVTEILDKAYQNISNLTNVELPSNLLTIGEDAFSGCRKLSEINIPNSITRVKARAFYNTAWLNSYDGDVVYIGKVCYILVNTTDEIPIVLPEYVVSITETAFTKSNITSIVGMGGLDYIGSNSFSECSKLTKVEFPNTTSDCVLDQQAFKNCSKLKEVKLGGCSRVSHNVFDGCSSIERIDFLGDSVPDLYSGAFANINPYVAIYVKPNLVDSWKSKLKSYSLDDNVYEYNSY